MPRRLMLDHLTGPVRSVGGRNLIPFTLELCNLRKHELQPGEQTLNSAGLARRGPFAVQPAGDVDFEEADYSR
jgi:hypothetical protein